MDTYQVVDFIFGAFLALLGWLGKTQWVATQKLADDLSAIDRALSAQLNETNLSLASDYVHKDDYRDDLRVIYGKLDLILEKLNGKADRTRN